MAWLMVRRNIYVAARYHEFVKTRMEGYIKVVGGGVVVGAAVVVVVVVVVGLAVVVVAGEDDACAGTMMDLTTGRTHLSGKLKADIEPVPATICRMRLRSTVTLVILR
jgi:hypothetical protein